MNSYSDDNSLAFADYLIRVNSNGIGVSDILLTEN